MDRTAGTNEVRDALDRGLKQFRREGAWEFLTATDLDQVLEDFERDMLRGQLSPNTVRTYRWGLQDLFDGMKAANRRDVRELSQGILEAWQASMTTRSWRPRTKQLAVNAARPFIRWAAERGLIDPRLEETLVKVKPPQAEPVAGIPKGDLAQIKAYLLPRHPRMNLVALRNRALFFYVLATGSSVSEALQVRRHDLVVPVIRGKAGTEQQLLMPPACRELVEDYLRARRDDNPWLWVTHKTNAPMTRLAPPGVREIWRKLARKLGLKPWTTHQLRLSPPGPGFAKGKAQVPSIAAAPPPKPDRPAALPAIPEWFEHVASVWIGTVERRPATGRYYHDRGGRGLSWMGRSLARAGISAPVALKDVLLVWDEEFYKHRALLGQKTDDAIRWMVPAMAEWGAAMTSVGFRQNNWDTAIEDWIAGRPAGAAIGTIDSRGRAYRRPSERSVIATTGSPS